MTPDDIRECLNSLAQYHSDISDNTAKILFNHKCYDRLFHLPHNNEWKHKTLQALLFHKICLIERYTIVQHVFDKLSECHIPYAVIKGAVLSQMAYGDPNRRISNDIDILIRHNDSDIVKELLCSLGFIQGRFIDNSIVAYTRREHIFYNAFTHQLAPFVYLTGSSICPIITVDINYDVFWSEYHNSIDMNVVLSESEKALICNTYLYKLAPEMEFIALCLHHYKDLNSLYLLYKGSLRLSLFFDIYYYWINNSLNMQKLQNLCDVLSASPYLYYCLYYVTLIFNDNSTRNALPLFYTEDGALLLNQYGLTEKERKTWRLDFFERLFCDDLSQYLRNHYTAADWQKITENQLYL